MLLSGTATLTADASSTLSLACNGSSLTSDCPGSASRRKDSESRDAFSWGRLLVSSSLLNLILLGGEAVLAEAQGDEE
jgi:hypothetical protein